MIGPADYGITEADLAADLAQLWHVTLMGTRRDGSSYVYTADHTDSLATAARLLDGQVSYVGTRTPRVDATLALAPELTAELVADLDTRQPVTVAIQTRYADGPPVDLAWLKGDASSLTNDGRLIVTGASDEQSILDLSELAVPWVPGAQPAAQLLAQLWDKAGATLLDLANPEGLTGATVDLEEVTDLWDAIAAVAASQGWRVYAPPRDQAAAGGGEIRRAPTSSDPTVLTLTTGPGGTVTELARRIARDEFANEVVTVYEWTDATGRDRRVIGRATDHRSADRATGNVRRATHRFRTSATQPQANMAATSLLRRAAARAVSYQVSAINAYWVRPDMVVSVPHPVTGAAVPSLVDQVTFTTEGVMHLVTRELSSLWTIADVATTYPTVAAWAAAYPTVRAAAAGPTS